MENYEYNRLIRNGKLNELANIWNISDLTRYKYHMSYLLEYLLENNIHTTIMDNYASKDLLWINLYLKYNIIKPLINVPLELLLNQTDNSLLLEVLLEKLNSLEKEKLYYNLKKNSYWLFHNHETLINNIFNKHGLNTTRVFIPLPVISDENIKVKNKLQELLNDFASTFNDCDENTLKTYVNEFKKMSKINLLQTYNTIKKMIIVKKKYPNFKLALSYYNINIEINDGEYNSRERKVLINEYRHGIFAHEISHLLYNSYEQFINDDAYLKYRIIQKKIRNSKKVNKIINYLKEFHERFEYMQKVFEEIYYAEIKKTYGSFNNYCNRIYLDIKKHLPDTILIDKIDTTIYVDEDNISECIPDLINDECKNYTKILVSNYYTEELMLENLFDALLNGSIQDHKYDIYCLSGHSKLYFETDKDSSFDEVLADFDAIKHSPKAKLLINKLRELTSNELVDFLENYIIDYRINNSQHANDIKVMKK